MKYFNGTLYTCECGYRTLSKDCASKHSKTKKCMLNVMNRKEMQFVSGEEHVEMTSGTSNNILKDLEKNIERYKKDIKEKEDTIANMSKTISLLTNLASSNKDDVEEDTDNGSGIIYYITDRDVPSRGKIGRTKNTDLKKLKSRYSTFSKPGILCFYSTNIKKDENDLKTLLKEKGCMDTSIGKETVVNCAETRAVFHDFASR
ncbi:protein of unknown function (DUF1390) [Paramecium bursaria Chlorella virus CVR-1]|uniref:Uncharacterized protein n=1 Tax=Paramecium bursaria Chlorella virus CVA-1 TaxID=42683 RepID=M1GXY4_9PHYC|nr:protein of unknown function (DUF1390) [Paramecium bursaria Chlorella virus CVA-1]AGE50423.1 protein of unknown function (DUF1390) [Paramecium bursaria Chlorella virus CVA-1]AGE52101.1 protein of unknown function (DUF1390) [Paramecium bursaria Chlorella virus CVR-1]